MGLALIRGRLYYFRSIRRGWAAPRFLVHAKWEYVTRIGHLSANYGEVPLTTPFLSQAALNSFGVA